MYTNIIDKSWTWIVHLTDNKYAFGIHGHAIAVVRDIDCAFIGLTQVFIWLICTINMLLIEDLTRISIYGYAIAVIYDIDRELIVLL